MKKKIAIALATVMTLSSAFTMNLFAAASVSASNIFNYKDKTLILDEALDSATKTSLDTTSSLRPTDGGEVGNGFRGTNLTITFDRDSLIGETGLRSFEVNLTGAEWAYAIRDVNYPTFNTENYASGIANGTSANGYYLYGQTITRNARTTGDKEIGYSITFNGNKTTATVQYEISDVSKDDYILIPLVMRTRTANEVKLEITNSNGPIERSTVILSSSGSGTSASALSIKSDKDVVTLDRITIRENAIGTFKAKGYFTIVAPRGYEFAATSSDPGTITNDALTLTDGTRARTPVSIYLSRSAAVSANVLTLASNNRYEVYNNYEIKDADGTLISTPNADLGLVAYYDDDMTKIVVHISNNKALGTSAAWIYFNGLKLRPENRATPDYGTTLSLAFENTYESGITAQSVEVAKFITYGLKYSAGTPKVFDAGIIGVNENKGETAKLTIEEEVAGSWLSNRAVEFILTDADGNPLDDVKIASVKVKTSNTNNNISDIVFKNTTGEYDSNPNYYFNRTGNTFIINTDLRGQTGKAKAEITFYISASANYNGPVYVKLGGILLPSDDASYVQNNGLVQVATVEQKVAVDTTTTPVQIGFQDFKVSDITITELKAGALERGKDIVLSIGEYGTALVANANLKFVPITADNVTVTSGDITVTPVRSSNASNIITLTVDRASRTASTITLRNLSVTVGQGYAGTFELNVTGDAILDNDLKSLGMEDMSQSNDAYKRYALPNSGIVVKDYIRIATTSNLALSKTITIYQNSSTVIVDGETQQLAAPTKNVDGRLYIPLRFIVEQFGARESDMNYDGVTGNIQITLDGRTVTWTKNSEYYVSGGVSMAMSDDGVLARAFISEEDDGTYGRTYIPYRYLAEAFNIPWVYDEATGGATYNPK